MKDTLDVYAMTESERDALARRLLPILRDENAALRVALQEIAHHYIDSKLASREKRGMAQNALNSTCQIQ